MNAQTSEETLALVKAAMGKPDSELAKAWVQGTNAVSGITAYDLEAPSKKLYPVITPLRNSIPRVKATGGIQANWRAVTGVNTTKVRPGVSDGNRGGVITTTTADYTAVYKELGLEDYVTFAADLDSEGFEDKKALAVEGLLRSMMIAEEQMILGGNRTFALGTTSNATSTSANAGGNLPNAISYGVAVMALGFDGYMLSSLTAGVPQTQVRTNADGSTDTINCGTAKPSAQANVSTATGANASTISASVAAVAGAVAYAWYWGVAAGNLTLGAITTINSVLITANATGNASQPGGNFNALTGTDFSQVSYDFDGLLTFASNPALGSYQGILGTGNAGSGTTLTPDGAGGVVEIETALKSFWDNYRLGPDTLWVNSQQFKDISTKVSTQTSSAPNAQRVIFQAEPGKVMGGSVVVRQYLNKFSMDGSTVLDIRVHPNMPPGTMLFTTNKLPYPLSDVSNVMQMRLRRDYYQVEWPVTKRRYEYGIYEDGVLQHYFPPCIGVITNIAAG